LERVSERSLRISRGPVSTSDRSLKPSLRPRREPHWVTFDDETVDDLPAIVFAQDEPFASTSMVAQWYVMSRRRSWAQGDARRPGGDEIFAGYLTSYGPYR
jgi:hypothetical protein